MSDSAQESQKRHFSKIRPHVLAIWLAIVRCDLGEELVAGNSGRGRELGLFVDARSNFFGGLPRSRDALKIVGYIQIGFIERERFGQWGVVLEDRLNLFGHFAVNVEPWRDEHEFGAFPNRNGRWHRRANPETSRLVARRGNDAAFRRIADRHRPALQGRIITLLDRRIERVHVDMDDLANRPFVHRRMWYLVTKSTTSIESAQHGLR